MEYTKNLNLKKPDVNEYYDIEKNNENMDLIDTAVGELNKNKIDFPDYSKTTTLLNGVGQYTITEDGFVQTYGYNNGTVANKPVIYLSINGFSIHGNHGLTEIWVGKSSPLFPVKKGDVVEIKSCTWSDLNRLYFIPFRE